MVVEVRLPGQLPSAGVVAARPPVLAPPSHWVTERSPRQETIRNRSGDRHKPSTLRGYEQALTERLLPHFGPVRLGDLRLADIQSFADRLLSDGLDPSTIRNHLMPLRAIYRRELSRGNVAVNPTTGLELPAVRGKRERFADPVEARRLIEALTPRDRALWATAIYAGLRRGELMALEWRDLDLDANVIRVERSWDVREGRIPVKSVAGRRSVPIPAALRRHLLEHGLATGRKGFVFGRTPDRPFAAAVPARRAARIWRKAGLEPIGLHECRHTYASLVIAAGCNAKALQTFMGHASVTITLDRYGHLFPGSVDEAAELLDTYLDRAAT